jgi:alkaline phosphatase D
MLGEEQWTWLEQELSEPADIRLIVSSVQVIAQGHGYERWGNLPRERNRLFELISRTNASGVIFLSGDRHIGALYKLDVGGPFPLYEVTSSSLNRPSSLKSEAGVYRLGEFYGRENFGMIAIDWVTESVSLELRDIEGEVVRQVVISLSEIGLPPLTGSKWKRFGKAVEELLAKERPEGEKVH